MVIYKVILEFLACGRLIMSKSKDLLLVDFDFTLVFHNETTRRVGWNLNTSRANQELLNILRDREFYVYTARGIGSYYVIKKWLKDSDLKAKGIIAVGSTQGKIRTVEKLLSRSKKRVKWYDDLSDVNFDLTIEHRHEMNIFSDNLEFIRL